MSYEQKSLVDPLDNLNRWQWRNQSHGLRERTHFQPRLLDRHTEEQVNRAECQVNATPNGTEQADTNIQEHCPENQYSLQWIGDGTAHVWSCAWTGAWMHKRIGVRLLLSCNWTGEAVHTCSDLSLNPWGIHTHLEFGFHLILFKCYFVCMT